jgi:hypothetical protein
MWLPLCSARLHCNFACAPPVAFFMESIIHECMLLAGVRTAFARLPKRWCRWGSAQGRLAQGLLRAIVDAVRERRVTMTSTPVPLLALSVFDSLFLSPASRAHVFAWCTEELDAASLRETGVVTRWRLSFATEHPNRIFICVQMVPSKGGAQRHRKLLTETTETTMQLEDPVAVPVLDPVPDPVSDPVPDPVTSHSHKLEWTC